MLKDFDQFGFFNDDAITFSSFAYRVTAARLIGRLLKLNQSFCPNSSEIVVSIDYSINNWFLHLPEHKKLTLDHQGQMDEMIFQAHMMSNA